MGKIWTHELGIIIPYKWMIWDDYPILLVDSPIVAVATKPLYHSIESWLVINVDSPFFDYFDIL